jgi:hypothetical protein
LLATPRAGQADQRGEAPLLASSERHVDHADVIVHGCPICAPRTSGGRLTGDRQPARLRLLRPTRCRRAHDRVGDDRRAGCPMRGRALAGGSDVAAGSGAETVDGEAVVIVVQFLATGRRCCSSRRTGSRSSSGRFGRATAAVVRKTHPCLKCPSRGVIPDLPTPIQIQAVTKSGVDALKSRGTRAIRKENFGYRSPTGTRRASARSTRRTTPSFPGGFQDASIVAAIGPDDGCPPVRSPQLPGNSLHGASRDRTGDLLLAKQALSQLSYGPVVGRV